MGVVYLAVRPADGSLVAVKTIRPALAGSAADVDRFLREAHILGQLSHPLIVAFRDSGEAGGQLFFAMDYVPGTDGGRLVKEEGPLPVGRAAGLVCQLLEALEYAHGLGFVHRDIKPANLLITREDDREVAKLADFGLARTYQSSKISGLTMMGEVGGSVSCMAPEQITSFREAKPPVDQYGAAATLYHLLTAEHVYDFPPELNKQIALILHKEPVPILTRRADLPPALARIIHQALSRDPTKRFANVQALRKALNLFVG
jgi:serine/threonine-protein kinase